jgi:manganese transport protein
MAEKSLVRQYGETIVKTAPRMAGWITSFGPAWLVMIADVDAASVITAAETGALYKYGFIWILLLLIIPLFFIQETAGRIGAVTGKGLGEVIRTHYSKKVAIFAAVPMALTDVLTYAAEYAGIAIGSEMIGIPVWISLPIAYMMHVLLVYKREYHKAEKILIGISAVLVVGYLSSLTMGGIKPLSPFYVSTDSSFLFLVAANVGAVIMPFMLFYQASATAERGLTDPKRSMIGTLIGAAVSELLMIVIVMSSSNLGISSSIVSGTQLAQALSVVGAYAPILLGLGLIGASFLALTVVSLGSAWGLVEALGFERKKAFPVYVLESIPALVAASLFVSNLMNFTLQLMVIFVFVLIGPAMIMGLLSSSKKVMGEHASTTFWRVAYWASLAAVISTGVAYAVLLI